jgi:hypothetical protein
MLSKRSMNGSLKRKPIVEGSRKMTNTFFEKFNITKPVSDEIIKENAQEMPSLIQSNWNENPEIIRKSNDNQFLTCLKQNKMTLNSKKEI